MHDDDDQHLEHHRLARLHRLVLIDLFEPHRSIRAITTQLVEQNRGAAPLKSNVEHWHLERDHRERMDAFLVAPGQANCLLRKTLWPGDLSMICSRICRSMSSSMSVGSKSSISDHRLQEVAGRTGFANPPDDPGLFQLIIRTTPTACRNVHYQSVRARARQS